jgi:hypothetical protein
MSMPSSTPSTSEGQVIFNLLLNMPQLHSRFQPINKHDRMSEDYQQLYDDVKVHGLQAVLSEFDFDECFDTLAPIVNLPSMVRDKVERRHSANSTSLDDEDDNETVTEDDEDI